jgi:uncharacterized membrane protein YccC
MDEQGGLWHVVSAVIGTLLSAAFATWAWVVKQFGKEHIDAMKDISRKIESINQRIDRNNERISALEGKLTK